MKARTHHSAQRRGGGGTIVYNIAAESKDTRYQTVHISSTPLPPLSACTACGLGATADAYLAVYASQ